MAIREIEGGQSVLTTQKKIKGEEPAQQDFQKFLQKAHSNLQGSFPGNGLSTVSEPEEGSSLFLTAILPLGPTNEGSEKFNLLSARTQGAKAAEEILDQLEHYCQAMETPGRSLKEIDPLLKSMAAKIDALTQWSEKLPSTDPLQKILSEASILSRVEIEKFNRGDYV
jgi:hypothetical protein